MQDTEPPVVDSTGDPKPPQEAGGKVEQTAAEDVAPSDEAVETAFEDNAAIGWKEKFKHYWRRYWRRPYAKLYTFSAFGVIVAALLLWPTSRYFILNNLTVRSSLSIAIYDQSTKQPLKNVQVSARGITGVTGSDGRVKLEHVKLGRTKLEIKRRAFAGVEKTLTIGWGSNPLGNMELEPVGAQYSFFLTDFLSNKPIENAEASSGELSGFSDKNGKIVLTVDSNDDQQETITVAAKGYRTEYVKLSDAPLDTKKLAMASSRKQPFVSKQSGKFDLYTIDVDGKNEKLVLKATGNEQATIGLVTHPEDEVAALVSTRDSTRNKDGFLLTTLTFVDLETGSTKNVAQSERVQVVGWVGTRLIFAQIKAGASAANAGRQKLLSYDHKTDKITELASANSFNDILLVNKDILYAPSNVYTPSIPSGLYKITADATNKQTLFDKEVWNVFRTDYETISLAVQQDWYQLKVGSTNKATKQNSAIGNVTHRSYADSPDGAHSLWIDERDGKGTIQLYDTNKRTEKTILTKPGLTNPVRWLDGHTFIYRIRTLQETADYVLNIEGGEPKKIRDVTHTDGVKQWYYY